MVKIVSMLLSSSDVIEPRIRADLEKIVSIGVLAQSPA
jgi:hypothetical protein